VTALELVSLLTQAIYVLIFVLVTWTALRRRTRTSVDIALFFGAIATAIVESRIVTTFGLSQVELITDIVTLLVIAMPYLLLRLVDDFSDVPAVVSRLAEAGVVLSAIAFVVTVGTVPPPILIAIVVYFAALSTYSAVAFVLAGRRSAGVTRRRLQAVAAGTVLLGVAILVAGFAPLLPASLAGLPTGLTQVLALASAIAYFIGFAPPQILRRAWQEPELRSFLRRAASLPRMPDTRSIVHALQDGAGSTLGARAAIGLFDPETNTLRFQDPHGVLPSEIGQSDYLAWRVFETQHAEYYPDAARAHPASPPPIARVACGHCSSRRSPRRTSASERSRRTPTTSPCSARTTLILSVCSRIRPRSSSRAAPLSTRPRASRRMKRRRVSRKTSSRRPPTI